MGKSIRKLLVTKGVVAFIVAVAVEQGNIEDVLFVATLCIVSVMVLCTEEIKKHIASNKSLDE